MNSFSYNNSFAFDAGILIMQVASTNYEADIRYLGTIFSNLIRIVHGKETDYHFGSPEQTFGWNFFTLSISREIVQQLNEVLGNEISRTRGDSIDQKFLQWLKKKYDIKKKSNLDIVLVSDLKSSRFGLF
jgi:hypothetical protein